MSGEVYRLEGIRFVYPASAGAFTLEIDSLRLEAGDILALAGTNGAGKTTLLTLLAFLARPIGGRLTYRGEDPWANEERLVAFRRDAVLATHHPYLFKGTVADNLAFGLRIRKIPEAEWPERIDAALSLVELPGWEKKPGSRLSAGQAQRVSLARAIILKPKVLLLDEPTAGIDAGLGLRLEAVLREISRESGTTIVFSTHDLSQSTRLADDILYLSEGRRVEFSHENCFSGTAATDGLRSWIEPRPGLRIVFPGEARGHVTCVIDPAAISLLASNEPPAAAPDGNLFRGRVTRMDLIKPSTALVRVSGVLTYRVVVPVGELAAKDISLSREVLLKFRPESVRIIES